MKITSPDEALLGIFHSRQRLTLLFSEALRDHEGEEAAAQFVTEAEAGDFGAVVTRWQARLTAAENASPAIKTRLGAAMEALTAAVDALDEVSAGALVDGAIADLEGVADDLAGALAKRPHWHRPE